jgi:hypothetical protein
MTARIADMAESEYRAAPGVNFSRLKKIAESPLHYKENPPYTGKAGLLGRLGHMALLEPDLYANSVAVFDGDKRTKAWKDFKLANEGKIFIGHGDHEKAVGMANSVRAHKAMSRYFDGAQFEKPIFWRHEFGIECKSKPDWFTDAVMIDPKTSGNKIGPRKFGYQCADLYYYAQMAFYHDALKAVDGRDRKVILLAIEQNSPFDVIPYVLSEDDLQAGRAKYEGWLSTVLRCRREDYWPGQCPGEMPLDLPGYVFDDYETAKTAPAPADRGDASNL